MLNEQWEYSLQHEPIFASIIGDKRYNDKLPDESIAAIKKDYEVSRKFLTRFEAIDTTGFPEQEALNKELMVQNLKDDLEGEKFEGYLMPVSQQGGIHIGAPQIVNLLSFVSVKDYDDYITRLKGLPLIVRSDYRSHAAGRDEETDASEISARKSHVANPRHYR